MKLRSGEWVVLGLVAAAFVAGWTAYPALPERIASHWNAQGQVHRTLPKGWGVFLMPVIMSLLAGLFLAFPRIDPKRANIEHFRGYYDRFIIVFFLFWLYVYGLILAWNFGLRFELLQWLAPALGVIFYAGGVLISHAEMNWTVGIRTPWTLSSQPVWEKTHALGGKLFRVVGVVTALGAVFPKVAFALILGPVLIVSLVLVVYSYLLYRRLT